MQPGRLFVAAIICFGMASLIDYVEQSPLLIATVSASTLDLYEGELRDAEHEPLDIGLIEAKAILDEAQHYPLSVETEALWAKHAIEEITKTTEVLHTVSKGETLSGIFSKYKISQRELVLLMEADSDYLSLDRIIPNDTITLAIDNHTNELVKMEIKLSLAETLTFFKESSGGYRYLKKELPTEWAQYTFTSNIVGSFSSSAARQGLSPSDVAFISFLFKDKINFSRDIKKGDSFEVVSRIQSVLGQRTGVTEIQAIRFRANGREFSAFLHKDGRFYDEEGKGLQSAFIRYPIDRNYRRITSRFNPRRLHPVTKRVSPHNGVDFATPIGANVYASGDGVVILTRNHPYAGKYVVIEHNSVYKSRYLHLDRILVKRGERVKRGQRIGLSGKTGRVTGAHLHYELLVRNKPVNPMTANIPMEESIPAEEIEDYFGRVASLILELENRGDGA
ncbi:peptidoglycan DD-metalloendopeptidase family protein [Vibrio breoganii]